MSGLNTDEVHGTVNKSAVVFGGIIKSVHFQPLLSRLLVSIEVAFLFLNCITPFS